MRDAARQKYLGPNLCSKKQSAVTEEASEAIIDWQVIFGPVALSWTFTVVGGLLQLLHLFWRNSSSARGNRAAVRAAAVLSARLL